MTCSWRALLAGAAFVAAGVCATGARADIVTYTLATGNTGLTESGPYATVQVNETSTTTATITFTAEAGFALVDSNIADLNVNGTVTTSLFTPGVSASGSGQVDGFGVFSLTTTGGGANTLYTTISYTITNTSGTWSSASNVLVANSDGNLAAAHIAELGTNCGTALNPSLCTGFAAVPGPTVGQGVPSLIAACAALFILARRRRQQVA